MEARAERKEQYKLKRERQKRAGGQHKLKRERGWGTEGGKGMQHGLIEAKGQHRPEGKGGDKTRFHADSSVLALKKGEE